MIPDWDQAYTHGIQDGCEERESSPRFALIGGLCNQTGVTDILDVGCGNGLLRASLPLHSSRYTGLDCSAVVIQRLKDRGGAEFVCADAEQWIPPRDYDAIILNEVLYYFNNPGLALSKYYGALCLGGIFIVSIYKRQTRFWQRNPNRRALNVLVEVLPHASRYEVNDGKGTWVVLVCKKTDSSHAP